MSNMPEGIKRRGTSKKKQYKWNEANQEYAVWEWLAETPIKNIVEGLGKKLRRDYPDYIPDGIPEGGALGIKVTKLLKRYRFEDPKFCSKDRSHCSFGDREDAALRIAHIDEKGYISTKYPNLYDFIEIVFGRKEKQARKRLNMLLGKDKQTLFG